MYKKITFSFLLFLTFISIFPKKVSAVTTTISNSPPNISSDEFSLDVTISAAAAGTNYLRVDLYKSGTTNYFGETFNGSEWYGESDFSKYYPVNVQSGSDWTGQIKARVGNPSSAEFDGQGQYKIRIRRYTSSDTYNAGEANAGSKDIVINIVSSTPTVTPSPVESSSPSVTPQTPPQNSPTPTLTTQPQTYGNIFVSEVMIDPETGTNEWVEIYNGNDFQVNLDNWFVDDLESAGTTPKKISLIANAKSYAVIELSNAMFNNEADSVRLLDFNQKEIDSIQYEKSEKGKSLGRISIEGKSFCLQTPSIGTVNNQCINPTPTPTPKPTTTIIPTPTSPPTKIDNNVNQIPPSRPIISTPTFSLFSQTQPNLPSPAGVNDENVLGATTEQKPSIERKSRAVVHSLSFASFGYSLLAGLSLIHKMKNNIT